MDRSRCGDRSDWGGHIAFSQLAGTEMLRLPFEGAPEHMDTDATMVARPSRGGRAIAIAAQRLPVTAGLPITAIYAHRAEDDPETA